MIHRMMLLPRRHRDLGCILCDPISPSSSASLVISQMANAKRSLLADVEVVDSQREMLYKSNEDCMSKQTGKRS